MRSRIDSKIGPSVSVRTKRRRRVVDLQRVGVDSAHQRLRVLQHVALALVEELEGERDVPRVDVVDVAQDRGVGNAVLGAGAEPGRDDPLEAGGRGFRAGSRQGLSRTRSRGLLEQLRDAHLDAVHGHAFQPAIMARGMPIASRSAAKPSHLPLDLGAALRAAGREETYDALHLAGAMRRRQVEIERRSRDGNRGSAASAAAASS